MANQQALAQLRPVVEDCLTRVVRHGQMVSAGYIASVLHSENRWSSRHRFADYQSLYFATKDIFEELQAEGYLRRVSAFQWRYLRRDPARRRTIRI